MRRPIHPPTPPPPPPMLGCTFLRLIKHIFFCHPGVCFFERLQRSETFEKLQLLSAIVWTHYEFPAVFHAGNTIRQCVVESPPLYYVAVQLIWPVMLYQRTHLKNKNKNMQAQKQPGVQDGPALPAFFCDVIVSSTSVGRLSLLCTCSFGSTQRMKETRHV